MYDDRRIVVSSVGKRIGAREYIFKASSDNKTIFLVSQRRGGPLFYLI